MTDNTASPYTVPLGWADLSVGVMIELRHKTYQAVVGEVENIMPDQGEGSSVRVGGMWCFDGNGWSLWVKPEPVERDPLIQVLLEARYPSAEWFDGRGDDPYEATEEEIAATLRAAGYMTEAEWETKRTQHDGPLLRWRNGDGPWRTHPKYSQGSVAVDAEWEAKRAQTDLVRTAMHALADQFQAPMADGTSNGRAGDSSTMASEIRRALWPIPERVKP